MKEKFHEQTYWETLRSQNFELELDKEKERIRNENSKIKWDRELRKLEYKKLKIMLKDTKITQWINKMKEDIGNSVLDKSINQNSK